MISDRGLLHLEHPVTALRELSRVLVGDGHALLLIERLVLLFLPQQRLPAHAAMADILQAGGRSLAIGEEVPDLAARASLTRSVHGVARGRTTDPAGSFGAFATTLAAQLDLDGSRLVNGSKLGAANAHATSHVQQSLAETHGVGDE